MANPHIPHPSSFRDPSGYIFEKEGVLYRQVNTCFREDFDAFIQSGLYDRLVSEQLLIPHEVLPENITGDAAAYLTLKPQRVPVISYPYEWSFDRLRDAALLTLQLNRKAIDAGFILKDATPYNIQWYKGRQYFIDTLSFERYNEQLPWVAYRQFCECFLSPLLLMHYSQQPLHPLSLAYPDGIPLALTRSLLPRRSKFSIHTYLHIHLHASIAGRKKEIAKPAPFSRKKMERVLDSLETLIRSLKTPAAPSTWQHYYEEASLRNGYLEAKMKLVQAWVTEIPAPATAADLGANDGAFSKWLASKGIPVIAADFDANCINQLYLDIKKTGEPNLQPLVVDLANPSPAIGVNNAERSAFLDRLQADLVLALALIHHLVIGKNIPLPLLASMFQRTGKYVLIEFVPLEDEKVQGMLSQRKNIFAGYTAEAFEAAFEKYFTILKKEKIPGSDRTLYLFHRRDQLH